MRPRLFYDEIQAFLLVAKCQNFSKVAEYLGTSNVQIMRKINSLESKVNYKLFERSNKQLRLTKYAPPIYQQLYHSLDRNNALQLALNPTTSLVKQEISISIPLYYMHLIQSVVYDIASKYPSIKIALHGHSYRRLPNIHTYDFLVLEKNYPLPQITWLKPLHYFSSKQIICATSENITLTSNDETLLEKLPYIASSRLNQIPQIRYKNKDCFVRNYARLSFDEPTLALQAVLSGEGYAIFPQDMVSQHLAKEKLTQFPSNYHTPNLELQLIATESAQNTSAVISEIYDLLVKTFSKNSE